MKVTDFLLVSWYKVNFYKASIATWDENIFPVNDECRVWSTLLCPLALLSLLIFYALDLSYTENGI